MRSTTRSVTVDSSVAGVGSSAPTMSSASWRALTDVGSTVSTVVPRRITVIASATESTSSSLCEMNRTVRPSDLSSRRLSKSSSTSCGTSTAVGSSRMMMLGAAVEDLEDLDALARADAEVGDEGVGVDVEAVVVGDLADLARAPSPMPCSFSAPSTTFSRTVKLSASWKCWNTMPMPSRDGVGR